MYIEGLVGLRLKLKLNVLSVSLSLSLLYLYLSKIFVMAIIVFYIQSMHHFAFWDNFFFLHTKSFMNSSCREMFTVIFALSRTVGWLSQWKEMAAEQPQKIVRPRQMFMGVLGPRAFVPLQQRTEGCSWEEAQEDRINNLRREAARTARVRASTLSLGVDSLKIGRVQNTQL